MSHSTHQSVRDLREGASWGPGQRLKNDAIYALVSLLVAALPKLPPAVLRTFGRVVARLAYGALGGARRIAHANIGRAFPSLGEAARTKLACDAFDTLGGFLGDAISSINPRRRAHNLRLSGGCHEVFAAALAERRGVVFVSAHLGPWESVARSLVAEGFPICVIARESYDPRLNRVYEQLRAPRGVRAIYRGRPEAVVQIVRALRQGAVVGIPMDLRSRVASRDVPFLGSPAPTAIGPARIALRTGAPVVAATAVRGDAGEVLISATRIPTADLARDRVHLEQSTNQLTARINAELGARILAWPEAWVWMHDRWRQ